MSGAVNTAPLAQRLWIYQSERFPLARHGAAIATFAIAGALLPFLFFESPSDATDRAVAQFLLFLLLIAKSWSIVVAIIVAFLFFLQLRIADEHKDFDADRRFRPERPVPRGLVRLAELRWIALGAALVQATLAYSVAPALLIPLALTWGWMALMTAEFFARAALEERPALTLVSHMAIMPFIALFCVACGSAWAGELPAWPAFAHGASGLAPLCAFLALAFANGAALEVARKSWAPEAERPGVVTYSKFWGPPVAAVVTVGAIVIAFALVQLIFFLAHISIWFSAAAVPPAMLGAGAAYAYGARPTPRRAETLEACAGLWALASYLIILLASVTKALPS